MRNQHLGVKNRVGGVNGSDRLTVSVGVLADTEIQSAFFSISAGKRAQRGLC